MVRSKALSKGTSKYKLIESTNLDNKSSGSTISDKSVQSTNTSNIYTTNNGAYDNKRESLSNGRLDLSSHFIHALFNNNMLCLAKVNLYINFILKQMKSTIVLLD